MKIVALFSFVVLALAGCPDTGHKDAPPAAEAPAADAGVAPAPVEAPAQETTGATVEAK